MSDSPQRRGRWLPWKQSPNERDWESSLVLEPILVPYEPEFISDGAGLPFRPWSSTRRRNNWIRSTRRSLPSRLS